MMDRKQSGFTLIEVLISLAITGIMMSAVYAVYIANVRAVKVEENKVEMQQNQRVALDFMTSELRMAACDKTESGLPSIVDARSNFIYFTIDRNSDGDISDPGEHIAFCIYNSPADGGRVLGYSTGSTSAVGAVTPAQATPGPSAALAEAHGHASHKPFAPLEELEFFYTLDDGSTTLNPLTTQLANLRSVQVTILARVETSDKNFASNETFTTPGGQQWGPYLDTNGKPDGIRRRMMTETVRFRNMGL